MEKYVSVLCCLIAFSFSTQAGIISSVEAVVAVSLDQTDANDTGSSPYWDFSSPSLYNSTDVLVRSRSGTLTPEKRTITFVKFDLSNLTSEDVNEVDFTSTLTLNLSYVLNSNGMNVLFEAVGAGNSWSNTVGSYPLATWPRDNGSVITAHVTALTLGPVVELDMTSRVQEWVNGTTENNGLVFYTTQNSNQGLGFNVVSLSSNYGSTEPPVSYTTNIVAVTSPDERLEVEILEVNGKLSYSVSQEGVAILLPSSLKLIDGDALRITQAVSAESNGVWKSVWGQFSRVRNQYKSLVLNLEDDGGGDIVLECRVFNDGVGLRFSSGVMPLTATSSIDFFSEYRWPMGSGMYWPNGEREPIGPVLAADFDVTLTPKVPVVVDAGEGAFAAVLESDLFSAELFSSVSFGHLSSNSSVLVGRSPATLKSGAWQTPWRVLLVGESPGDLLVSSVPLNLAAECKIEDTSWIKPGKTMWDWRVYGYEAEDGFIYGVNTESYLRFIDFAASNNVQYFLIDDSWFTAVTNDQLIASTNIDLTTIMNYAAERNVGVLLYYDRRKGTLEDSVLFPQLAGLGAAGTKYGFMGNNASFTRGAIAGAADSQLLINFHDSPCPMTGVERTLPNAVTREYCHAQMDSRRAFSPTAFLKMAMINALTGPLDQANGNFGLNGINAGEREKGPRILDSYDSTVVSEVARVLVISGGLICLPDAPEEYEKKADLFDFIRRMPATWGETRVINSDIGQHITTARRYGNEWFVGSVINETGGELAIPLDFLASNIVHDVTYYEDTTDTHCETNREAYQIRQGVVTRDDTITATLAAGGGHCMWIRPQKSLTVSEQGVSVAWDSSEDESYEIERTDSLDSSYWVGVASNLTTGTWLDSSDETRAATHMFFRIQVEQR